MKRIFLVDFENVHTGGLKGAKPLTDADEIVLFYADNDEDSVAFIRELRDDIQHAKIVKNGQNALDFQLSSYLGFIIKEASCAETFADTLFIIVSKDSGFESVITFWTNSAFVKHIKVNPKITQADSIHSALFPTPSNSKVMPDKNPDKKAIETLIKAADTLGEFHSILVKKYGMPVGSELYAENKARFKELKKI